jgi:hypothetical protein
VEWEEGEEERRDAEADLWQRGQRRRMENREPDVGIAVGALQTYPSTIMRCRRRGIHDRVSL